jgi:choline dehydrogenase-like flavoprotein
VSGQVYKGGEQPGNLSLDADVVVVGSGASGAVVATLLAEAGQRVVVIEEGRHFTPEQYGAFRPSEHLREMWRDAGLTFTIPLGDSPAINVMVGRCVGGSSLLTGGVCFRTPESVLRVWQRERGLDELSPEAMDGCFAEVERNIHVEEVPLSLRSRSTALFGEGAAKLGYPLRPTRRNTRGCDGCSKCNFGCPQGAKMSVDITYLPRAIAAGAQVWSECLVDTVEVEGDRAVGVRGRMLNGPHRTRGGKLFVRARRVVIAAGAVHTPLLLKRTGVGKASGQVGRNLTLHPGFRVMARFDEEVNGWSGALQSAYSDRYEDERVTLMSLFTPPGILAATMPGIGPEHVERANHLKNMAMFGGILHDDAGGVIHRAIGREPYIGYRMSPPDRAAVNRLLRILADTFFAAGAREVYLPVLGLPPITADQLRAVDLEHLPARKFECSSQHPLGTARMGSSPKESVVTAEGETWDVRELFVVDGSIIPTSLGVNPQLTIMAMATRIGWKLRERPLPLV